MFKTIFFDVDGTLTANDNNAWNMITIGLGMSLGEHRKILEKFRAGKIDLEKAVGWIVSMWRRSGKANKTEIERILSQVQLRPGAIELVEHLRSANRDVVLLSGTPDLNLTRIKQLLNLEKAITSTRFVFDTSGEIEWFEYAQDEAQAKLEHFKMYLHENSLLASECVMVGNGDNDLLVMDEVALVAAPSDTSSQSVLQKAQVKFVDLAELIGKI